jgi:hypothetical protein
MEKSKRFDFCIAPEKLKDYKFLDTLKAAELFEVGYEATKDKLKNFDILKVLTDKKFADRA